MGEVPLHSGSRSCWPLADVNTGSDSGHFWRDLDVTFWQNAKSGQNWSPCARSSTMASEKVLPRVPMNTHACIQGYLTHMKSLTPLGLP